MPQILDERSSQHNHQTPRLSATTLLILEREGAEVQVFVLKRQNRGGFLQDALVFPGGVVEECDYAQGPEPEMATKMAAIREIAEETALQVEIGALHAFSWWLTPTFEKRRFNTHFFVAPYPCAQSPVVNPEESEWGRLIAPSEILAMHEAKSVRLLPPTLLSLETICGLTRFEEVKAKALELESPICPKLEISEDGTRHLVIPCDLGLARTRFAI